MSFVYEAYLSEKQIDQALVDKVKAGDQAAFGVLVSKYQSRIMHLVSRYVRNQAEVEDVTQEAFIKAYRGLKNFRGESAFYTWMYRVAINTAKNHLVSMGRKAPGSDIDAQEAEQYESATALKEYATPERLLMSEEMRVCIQNTIRDLPIDLKTAITLREYDGLSYEEIAETMDCPIGTVRSRIFRAREAIENALAELNG